MTIGWDVARFLVSAISCFLYLLWNPCILLQEEGGRLGRRTKIYGAEILYQALATLWDGKILLQRSQGTEFSEPPQLSGARAKIQTYVHLTPKQVLLTGAQQLSMVRTRTSLWSGKEKEETLHTYEVQAFPFVSPALPRGGQLGPREGGVLFQGGICLTIGTCKDHTRGRKV